MFVWNHLKDAEQRYPDTDRDEENINKSNMVQIPEVLSLMLLLRAFQCYRKNETVKIFNMIDA